MAEYLVTDIRTNTATWVSAVSPTAALVTHENSWRKTPLPASTKASDYSNGGILDVSLGESSIRGLSCRVCK